jgi:hypothetical protein
MSQNITSNTNVYNAWTSQLEAGEAGSGVVDFEVCCILKEFF